MRWKGNTGEERGTRNGGHEDDRTEVRATGSVYLGEVVVKYR